MTRRRILVVEDNPLNLKLVRDVLGAAGYDVVAATSGEEGLRLAGRAPAGPGADGPPAAGHRRHRDDAPAARRTSSDPRVPVVAVTAFAMAEDHAQARDGGLRRRTSRSRSACARLVGQVRSVPGDGDSVMSRRPVTVLAVDDEPANLRLLDAVLSPRGYRVVPAASGQEALRPAGRPRRRPGAARRGDARAGRARGVSADPGARPNGVPAGRDDHCQRRPAAARRPGGRGRRLHHQAVRPGRAARAGGLPGPAQALPRHDRAAGRRAGGVEHRAGATRRRRVAELERTNRLRHFLVAAARRGGGRRRGAAGQPPPRDRRGLLRLPRLHLVRRDQRARGGDGRAARLPRGRRRAGRTRTRGTLERFTGDGIMVFFNDPVPCDDPAERAVRLALDVGRDGPALAGELATARSRADAPAPGSPRATPRWAGSASPDASTTPPSAASPTSRPACATTPATGRCGSATGCWRRSGDRAEADLVGDVQLRGFARPVRVHNIRVLRAEQVTP